MDNVIPLPPVRPREGIRYISVYEVGVEFVIGIEYWDGDHILAGAFFTHAEALEAARVKAKSLGARVVDMTFSEPPSSGGAA